LARQEGPPSRLHPRLAPGKMRGEARVKAGGEARIYIPRMPRIRAAISGTTNKGLRRSRLPQKNRGKVERMPIFTPTDSAEEANKKDLSLREKEVLISIGSSRDSISARRVPDRFELPCHRVVEVGFRHRVVVERVTIPVPRCVIMPGEIGRRAAGDRA